MRLKMIIHKAIIIFWTTIWLISKLIALLKIRSFKIMIKFFQNKSMIYHQSTKMTHNNKKGRKMKSNLNNKNQKKIH